MKIGADLDSQIEANLVKVLHSNLISFAWNARDMLGIDPNLISHRLKVNPKFKAKIQRRRRLNDEKAEAATAEVRKLQRGWAHKGNSISRMAC